MSFYPSPVENSLTGRFEENQSKGQLFIISAEGKIISKQACEGQNVSLSTENLKSRIYFLRVQQKKALA